MCTNFTRRHKKFDVPGTFWKLTFLERHFYKTLKDISFEKKKRVRFYEKKTGSLFLFENLKSNNCYVDWMAFFLAVSFTYLNSFVRESEKYIIFSFVLGSRGYKATPNQKLFIISIIKKNYQPQNTQPDLCTHIYIFTICLS